ncbi:MAG TPA: flippase [Candidatus Binatus sp.]|nr:flippase [Candidatus Binatus sp.]
MSIDSQSTAAERLTSAPLLARNTLWNILGEVAPLIVTVFAIPILLSRLGVDRYGVLSLAWVVVGYFGVFDLGLGRAATKFIADALGAGDEKIIPGVIWTSLLLMVSLGVIGAVVMGALSPWMIHRLLDIPKPLQAESVAAFLLLAASLPVVISSSSLLGALAALQRFDLLTGLRIAQGWYSLLAPLAVLPFSHSLFWIVAVLVAGRVAGWIASLIMCLMVLPDLGRDLRPRRALVAPLFSFGGWITLTNLAGPVMAYFDRFLIGSMLSVAAVAYYSVPQQLAGKLLIVPASLSSVLFPAFASTLQESPGRAIQMFERGAKCVFLVLFPLALVAALLAPEFLTLWLGATFAANTATVLRWLIVGVFVNGLAYPPFTLIQAANRPDLTGKLHIAELPFYFALLFWLLPAYGIAGAAFVWSLRTIAEAIVLFAMAWQVLPAASASLTRICVETAAALAVVAVGIMLHGIAAKAIFLTIILGPFAWAAWFWILDASERRGLLANLRFRTARPELAS